jgi:UDPglucose--hexose-1-phosphate uridylyltransferase
MPELRHDPIQKRWAIISTDRSRRPDDSFHDAATLPREGCPFCEGNENKTPPEIIAVRHNGSQPNRPGWQVRVVPNKFPALKIEGELGRRGVGVHDWMNGVGAHEVIIETPRHEENLPDSSVDHIQKVIWTYRERLVDLSRDTRLRYMLIFKNHGAAAGATLSHPHTQLIATPVVPLTLAHELNSAREHFLKKERCLFCDIIGQELESGERIVVSGDEIVAFTPFASRFPFEIFLAPRNHHHSFAAINDRMMRQLAAALKDVLLRLKKCLGDPSYNFLIHTIPNIMAAPKRSASWDTVEHDFHWHMEIMPRITRVAGFEWGTGFYINPTAPEEAARCLRDADV